MELFINLSHLKYFLDAAEEESLTVASKRNNVTHSTISQGIKRLEESLGVRLLLHKKRKFLLTTEGKNLLNPCQNILYSVKDLERHIECMADEPTGEISVASSQSILSACLLKCFSVLKKKYRNLSFSFEIGRTQEIKNFVVSRKVEIGVTIDDGQLFELSRNTLATGNFILVSRKKIENIERCSGFILTRPRPETELLKTTYKKKFKKDLPVLYEVDSWGLIKEVVRSDNVIGLIPDFVLQSKDKLVATNWYASLSYRLIFVTRKNELLSKPAEIFVNKLRENLRT